MEQEKPEKTSEAPLEKVFGRIISPFEEFIHKETTSGILLMICAIAALIMANTALQHSYEHVLHLPLSFAIGDWVLEKTLHHWINDGLMALFFFVVGLEIKREILVGELADIRQASLPIMAAIGGMVVPAGFYVAINLGEPSISGWGIPMATDIAFAVGAMVLLGKRVPKTLLTFLVALAIVDDLGGVLVIALFYTEQIHFNFLGMAAFLFLVLVGCNLAGIRNPAVYLVFGLLLWLAMLKSGVHATLAGVLTALTIPARSKYEPLQFSRKVRALLDRFDASHKPGRGILRNAEQHSILQTLENGVHLVETPLQRLERGMHLPVAFLIIPIFALANAGIPLELSSLGEVFSHPVTAGVMAGLIAGKFIGISLFSWLAIKSGISRLPQGVRFSQIGGVALLAGIGFTMSIFIAELAFSQEPQQLLLAKTGILFASLIAGVGGYIWLRLVSR